MRINIICEECERLQSLLFRNNDPIVEKLKKLKIGDSFKEECPNCSNENANLLLVNPKDPMYMNTNIGHVGMEPTSPEYERLSSKIRKLREFMKSLDLPDWDIQVTCARLKHDLSQRDIGSVAIGRAVMKRFQEASKNKDVMRKVETMDKNEITALYDTVLQKGVKIVSGGGDFSEFDVVDIIETYLGDR